MPQLDVVDRGIEFGLKSKDDKPKCTSSRAGSNLYDAGAGLKLPSARFTTGQAMRLSHPGDVAHSTDPAAFSTAKSRRAPRAAKFSRQPHPLAANALPRSRPPCLLHVSDNQNWNRTLPDQAGDAVSGLDESSSPRLGDGRWPANLV